MNKIRNKSIKINNKPCLTLVLPTDHYKINKQIIKINNKVLDPLLGLIIALSDPTINTI